MARKYRCDGCDNRAILGNLSTAPTILCAECGTEMEYVDRVAIKWVGHQTPHTDYATMDKADDFGGGI